MQNSLNRNAIKYIGVSEALKNCFSNFKVFTIDHTINLVSPLPSIEDIVQVSCNINILSYKIIETPKGRSFEGHILTGKKIFFKSIINCNIQYYSNDDSKGLHFYSFNIFFIDALDLSANYLLQSNIVSIEPNIIDISSIMLDDKKIYLTIVCNVSINS